MPKGALTKFTVCDTYHYCAGQALLVTSQNMTRIELLIPTNDIIVIDWYFNLTNKSILTDML